MKSNLLFAEDHPLKRADTDGNLTMQHKMCAKLNSGTSRDANSENFDTDPNNHVSDFSGEHIENPVKGLAFSTRRLSAYPSLSTFLQ